MQIDEHIDHRALDARHDLLRLDHALVAAMRSGSDQRQRAVDTCESVFYGLHRVPPSFASSTSQRAAASTNLIKPSSMCRVFQSGNLLNAAPSLRSNCRLARVTAHLHHVGTATPSTSPTAMLDPPARTTDRTRC